MARVWEAGTTALPAVECLQSPGDRAGHAQVGPDLIVPGYRDIFVIADAAQVVGPDGRPVPGVAPVAAQQGYHVASVIRAACVMKTRCGHFDTKMPDRWRPLGSMS